VSGLVVRVKGLVVHIGERSPVCSSQLQKRERLVRRGPAGWLAETWSGEQFEPQVYFRSLRKRDSGVLLHSLVENASFVIFALQAGRIVSIEIYHQAREVRSRRNPKD
jgi:hypothetical protein